MLGKSIVLFKTPVLSKGEEYITLSQLEVVLSTKWWEFFFCFFFSQESIWREIKKRNRERNLRPCGTKCVDSSTSSNMTFLNLFFELSWTEFENKLNIFANKKVLNKTIIFSKFQMSKLKPRKVRYIDLVSKSDLKACLTI